MQLSEFLHLLKGVTGRGNQYKAKCPTHDDKDPSLSIGGSDGKILLHCHAGCTQEAIVTALGLNMSDLFTVERKPAPQENGSSAIVATYDYVDENGTLLYQSVRKAPKSFYQRRPDPAKHGSWLNNLQKVRRVLYSLPSVLAAVKDGKPIYFVEGEKDADRLNSLGYVATTSGSSSSWRDELATSLCGADVIIVPDNDPGGMTYANKVAKSLVNQAKSIALCEIKSIWADVPGGGDISDLLNVNKDSETDIIKALQEAGKPYSTTQNDAPVGQDKGSKPVFDMDVLQGWLASVGLTIRYNMISRKVEIIGEVPRSIPREHGNALLPIIIHDSLKGGYKQCSRDTIQDLLNVLAVQNRINPITEMLGTQTWDGIDRLPQGRTCRPILPCRE